MFGTIKFILNHPLNRDRRLAAVSRYVRWQVGSRILRHPAIVPFTDHARLIVATSMYGATGNIYCGLHEFEDMAFILHFLRSDDHFVDIGANVGTYTVLASKVCGARTVAIEPVPATFNRLLDNIVINDIQHITKAVRMGLGSTAGVLRFTSGLDTMNSVVPDGTPSGGPMIECPISRLDDLVAGTVPIFVKLDVEGFEAEVVAGGTNTFSNESLRGALIETNANCVKYGRGSANLHTTMLGFGFRSYSYHPFKRELKENPNPDSANTLYLRNIEFAIDRVNSANPVSIYGRPL